MIGTDPPHGFAERRFAWLGEPLPAARISFEFFPPKTPAGEEIVLRGVLVALHHPQGQPGE